MSHEYGTRNIMMNKNEAQKKKKSNVTKQTDGQGVLQRSFSNIKIHARCIYGDRHKETANDPF